MQGGAETFLGVPALRLRGEAAAATDTGGGAGAGSDAGATAPRAVLIGAGMASPYRYTGAREARAPAAIRAAGAALAELAGNVDFDLGRPAFAPGTVADLGDLELQPAEAAGNRLRIRQAVAEVRAAGAVPVVLGGDASVLVPALQGQEGRGPLWVVQIGARLGWREQREGERWGAASALRRASEMGHVAGLVQIGARGPGDDRAEDLAAARAAGVRLMTAPELARAGLPAALALLPEGAAVHLAIDCDALDPAAMPAVAVPLAGGLGYLELLELARGTAARGRLAGISLCGLVPDHDAQGLGAALAAQLVLALLGLATGPSEG